MTLNLALLLENPLLLIAGAVGLVTIKVLVIVAILRRRHDSYKESFQLALMLSQGGEFAFVVLSQATQLQFFDTELSEQLTLVVGLSMALTSPLVMLHRKIWHSRSESQPDQDGHWETHEPEVIIAGFGRFGQVIGRMLAARHIPFTAMDKDSAHVEFVRQSGNRIFFGDSARLDLLKSAGIENAKILVVAVDSLEDSLAIVDIAQQHNPHLTIVARAKDRFHAYELHKRDVTNVIRETFSGSLEAAANTLEHLGYTEGQALEIADMFRHHDESLLLKSVQHKDDMDELLVLAKQGRKELQRLFNEDKNNPVSR